MLKLGIAYMRAKFDHSCFSCSWDIVGAYQNLDGSRDLTMSLSGIVCHPWASTCYVTGGPSLGHITCIQNLVKFGRVFLRYASGQTYIGINTQTRSSQYFASSPSCLFLCDWYWIITGPPNWPVLFCSLVSVGVCRLSSSVTLPAGQTAGCRARVRSGGRHYTAGLSCYVPLRRHLVFNSTDICF